MNIRSLLSTEGVAAPLLTHWQTFSPQSRRIMLSAFAMLAVGLVWAFVYAPMQSSRKANAVRIANLISQQATMQRQAVELAALKSIAPVTSLRTKMLADKSALDGIFGAASKVDMTSNAEFRIVTARMRYVDWLDRVDQSLARFSLQITSLELKRLDGKIEGGTEISAEITFADSSPVSRK